LKKDLLKERVKLSRTETEGEDRDCLGGKTKEKDRVRRTRRKGSGCVAVNKATRGEKGDWRKVTKGTYVKRG